MKRPPRQSFPAVSLLVTILCTGCSSLAQRGLLPEVASRRPPAVFLGAEIMLLDKPAKQVASVVSSDGHAHLFAMDEKGQLYHMEVDDENMARHTVFDIIDPNKSVVMDAVAQPTGQLRFLAGDQQYIFSGASQSPRVLKGNRCERFLPTDEKLFCAFVISGKEAGAPKRTDVTAGWFILVPIVFWSTEQVNKLVLAEEIEGEWRIRAVVDPETKFDADHDFIVGIDNQNQLHVLYFASRGGGFFGVFLGAGGGGGGFIDPIPEWRYAKLKMNHLIFQRTDASPKTPMGTLPLKLWIQISSTNLKLSDLPFLDKGQQSTLIYPQAINYAFRPLNRHFTINPSLGDAVGIVPGKMFLDEFWGQMVDSGNRKLDILSRDMWLEIQRHNSEWIPDTRIPEDTIVAAEDIPNSTYNWSFYDQLGLLKSDRNGVEHALLYMGAISWWGGIKPSIEYFQKNEHGWSAPIRLGDHGNIAGCCRELAVSEAGDAFAVWSNEQGKLVGRWIKKTQRGKTQ